MTPEECEEVFNCDKVEVRCQTYNLTTEHWEFGKIIGTTMEETFHEQENDYGHRSECRDCELLVLVALDSDGMTAAFNPDSIRATGLKYTLEEMLTHRNQDVRENAQHCFKGEPSDSII